MPRDLGSAYLVQLGLGTGEGEGESYWKLLILDVLLLHEVAQTISNVSKELRPERRRERRRSHARNCCTSSKAFIQKMSFRLTP